MQIVDNSPEMDPTSPEFAKQLAEISAGKPKADEKGEKSEKALAPSDKEEKESPSPKPEAKDESEEEADDIDSKVKALKKELKRVRDSKREDEDRVTKLQEEISSLKAKVDKAPVQGDERSRIQAALDKLDEDQLEAQLTNWDDELADARAKLALAEDRQDEAKAAQAEARISKARTVLSMTRTALRERNKKASEEKSTSEREKTDIAKDLDGIFKTYVENFPDLEDKDSKLWEAGNAMFNKYPTLMKRLGPIAELVAVSLAVSSDPKLIGKDSNKVRKDLLHNIEEAAHKSLITGGKGGGKSKGPIVDTSNMEAFEAYIEKVKSGG